ncbi:MAG: porin [Niabella sp.]
MNPTQTKAKDTVSNYSSYKRKLTANALLIGSYTASLTDSVGVDGVHSMKDSAVNNSFSMRYIRLSARYEINDRFDIGILVNLADFKKNTQTRVVENAFMRYKMNDFVNLQFGQFRPYFGIEDIYGVESHKSYYWSNQYNLFGNNNWMSFQIGAALYGSLQSLHIPLKYYFTVYNGNGKNMENDNDNTKDFATRLETSPIKGVNFGANFASTKYKRKAVGAYAFDLQTKHKLADRWDLETETSYAYGYNLNSFAAAKKPLDSLSFYRMKGIYVLPLVRYNINKPRFRGMEFSFRYETLLDNISLNKNPRNSYVPMLSFLLADNNAAKFSIIGVIDRYKHNIRGTSQYDQNQILAQFQLRF